MLCSKVRLFGYSVIERIMTQLRLHANEYSLKSGSIKSCHIINQLEKMLC